MFRICNRLWDHAVAATQSWRYNTTVLFPHLPYSNPTRCETIIWLCYYSDSVTDFAELNAPPMINYGVVYPQAILMFVITMLYSVVQPLIVIFGAIYFGVGYIVYKYKLLFGAPFPRCPPACPNCVIPSVLQTL